MEEKREEKERSSNSPPERKEIPAPIFVEVEEAPLGPGRELEISGHLVVQAPSERKEVPAPIFVEVEEAPLGPGREVEIAGHLVVQAQVPESNESAVALPGGSGKKTDTSSSSSNEDH
ncbi:uncharacterized protein LOC129961058 isoform X1 [Argiope bruennichi]|uniref:uncharacterized protein LOC129961058 isoform X1 n=1 Tax=Argiope bruennichi TaxID=94029 RepID=UPI002495151E|nr:uncharacterized protein LOC129961058 isoform X1 [Argiope bruennichi]